MCALATWGNPTRALAEPLFEPGKNLLYGRAFEIGGIAHVGYSEYASSELDVTPEVFGVVIRDRHGLTSRVIAGVIVALAAGAAAAGPKSVESRTYRSGHYIVTETKTTYHTQAEKEEIRRNANKTVDGLFKIPMADFELELYGRNRFGFGESVGYKMNMLFGGSSKRNAISWEFGFGWGNVDSRFTRDGTTYEIDHKYLGMPIRVNYATSLFVARLTWEWNWLAHGVSDEERTPTVDMNTGVQRTTIGHHPFNLDFQTAFFGRVYAQAGVSLVRKKKIGYHASAGMRF